jgi:hypothetical protein
MTKDVRHRHGFALPVAVFALVVVGVLVTGGFYLARQETRIGVASKRATTSFYVAEQGAMEVMSEWDMSTFSALSNWASATVQDTTDNGTWSVTVTKMTPRLYFLLSTGTATEGEAMLGGASRMLGMIARLTTADILPQAALTTVGELRIGGSSYINGYDSVPDGWGGLCNPPGNDKPGVLIDSLSNVSYSGNSYGLEGDPGLDEDNNLNSDSLLTFGDLLWYDLVALADIQIPHNTTMTQLDPDSALVQGTYVCQTGAMNNWGDPQNPTGACGNYFPIIYATGDLKINANDQGQGILLVEGDLAVQGGHSFFGPVIVRGELKTAGTGGHFNGGVIAANVNLDTSTVLGNALIQFSACSIERAVLNNSALTRVRPLAQRSWVDLSSVISG